MKIDPNQFISDLRLILKVKYLMFFPRYMLSPVVIQLSCKFSVGEIGVFKRNFKNSSYLTFNKMLGSNITITEEIVQKAKVFVQVIICNGKLNKHYVSTIACLNENLKTKSSAPLTPNRS